MYSTNSQWYQLFKLVGDQYIEGIKSKKVIEIAGGKDAEAQPVGVGAKGGSA